MIKKQFKVFVIFFLIGILSINFVLGYTYSNPQYTQAGFGYSGGFGFTGGDYIFDREMCQAGQDFILQVDPLGCTPSVVRSDLLEEQNVYVFCPISATKINPLIDVKAIDYLTFRGDYAPGVANVGFHPVRSALGYKDQLNSPVLENIGYAVIELKRNPVEANIPDFIEGNITARIVYDVENAFGVGDASFYLRQTDDGEWESEFLKSGFWTNRGYLRADNVEADRATISVYSGKSVVLGKDSFQQRIATFNLEEGQKSPQVYLPTFDYCLGGLEAKLDDVQSPGTTARLRIDSNEVEVMQNEKFLNGRCRVVGEPKKVGINQEVTIRCSEDIEGGFGFGASKDHTLRIVPNISLNIGNENINHQIGDFLYYEEGEQGGIGEKAVFLAYAYFEEGESDFEKLKALVVTIPVNKLQAGQTRLTEDELDSFESFEQRYRTDKKFFSGSDFFGEDALRAVINSGKFAGRLLDQSQRWLISGEDFYLLDYQVKEEIRGKEVELRGLSGPYDSPFAESNPDHSKANKDFDTLIKDFSEQKADETLPGTFYGEEGLYEKIKLANSMDQKITLLSLCEEFKTNYPDSKLNDYISQLCKNNVKLSNSEISRATVLIDGEFREISLQSIDKPSFEDYNAEIFVTRPDGTSFSVNLGQKDIDYVGLSEQQTEFSWPFESKRVTSCFGKRDLFEQGEFHDGIDMGGNGLNVLAAADGQVVQTCVESRNNPSRATRKCNGYGTNIIIDHGNGYHTVYNHLQSNSLKVKEGDFVRKGEQIALSGNTGVSTGAHLHFGIYQNIDSKFEDRFSDKGINPLCFLPSEGITFDAESCSNTFEENTKECESYGKITGTSRDYIQLMNLEDESAIINFVSSSGGKDLGLMLDKTETYRGYSFTLKKVNLNKVAKVSILPRINYAETEASFNFKIGVDKRLIKLSPEKAQEKIEKLDKSIEDWEKISNTLGTTVQGLKTACLATGAALTVSNLFENLKGKGIARQEVMKRDGGWYDFCAAQVNKGVYNTVDTCLIENSDAIDKDVQSMTEAIKRQDDKIQSVQSEYKGEKKFLDETVIDTEEFVKDAYSGQVQDVLEGLSESDKNLINSNKAENEKINFDEIEKSISSAGWDNGNYDVEDLRKIELYSTILRTQGISDRMKEIANKELYSVLFGVQKNAGNFGGRFSLSEDLGGKINPTQIGFLEISESSRELPYNGLKLSDVSEKIQTSYPSTTPIEILQTSQGKKYLIVLDDSSGTDKLPILRYDDGDLVIVDLDTKVNASLTEQEKSAFDKIHFKKYDETSYKNPYVRSSDDPNDPVLKFYESDPYKGLPAIVPFDLKNGWYAASKRSLPVGANVRSYDESGRVNSFYLCNVGQDGVEEFLSDDDICQRIDLGTSKTYNNFAGLESSEAVKLVEDAVSAIEQASIAYKRGIKGGKVRISTRRGTYNIKIGSPAVDTPGLKCQDFMSPKECNLLFNLCDPVICPSSRCNFGGAYEVKDVIQTGVIGGATLCLPNFKGFGGDVYAPVCLTGIKAGVDGWNSVQEAYRDCLQTNLETGETIGICDEIHSVYACEFFWRQGLPLAKLVVPKVVSSVVGQGGTRGGGEYLSVADAFRGLDSSLDFFTQTYGVNSYAAFKARSTEGVGTEICRNYASIVGPKGEGVINALTEPDSPSQYTGWFDEIPFTTATVPPVSQYKVFYHIYAGEDRGAFYRVYLRSNDGAFYQDASYIRVVDSGYIAAGDSATQTRDFTAPEGYSRMCIMVNGIEECGLKQVSTSLAVDFVEANYLKEQAEKTGIRTENECISGSAGLYNLLNPNLQSAVESAIDPAVYEKGIIRICATNNPGQGTDTKFGTETPRWTEVGYCGDEKLKCWLDTNSVKDVINSPDIATLLTEGESTNIRNTTLNEIYGNYLNVLEQSGYYVDFNKALGEIEAEKNLLKRISIIDGVLNKVRFSGEKAKLFLLRGQAYAKLAVGAYDIYKDEQEQLRKQREAERRKDDGVSPVIPSIEEKIKKFEFRDRTFSTNICYAYFDTEWHWTGNCVEVGRKVPQIPYTEVIKGVPQIYLTFDWISVNEDSEEFFDLNSRNQNFVGSLKNKNYQEGLKLLIDRVVANDEGGWFGNADLIFDRGAVEVRQNEIFVVSDENFGDIYLYFTEFYFGEQEKWYWNLEDQPKGDNSWRVLTSLEGKNFLDGAEMIFKGEVDFREIYPSTEPGATEEIDKLFIDAYLSYEDEFNKYSEEFLPKGFNQPEFKALLVAISQIETGIGTAGNKCGARGSDSCSDWLMGYGATYPERYRGAENQINVASELLKRAFEGEVSTYNNNCDLTRGQNNKDEAECIFNTYRGFGQAPEYGDKVLDLASKWEIYFGGGFSRAEIINIRNANECGDCGNDENWYTFGLGNICDVNECLEIGKKISGGCAFERGGVEGNSCVPA